MRHSALLVGLPIAAMYLLAATAPAVAGAAGAGTPEPAPAKHCTYDVRTAQQRCFGSLEEATSSARQQQVASSRDGEIIQATLFDGENFGGDSFTVYGAGTCEKDGKIEYQIDLPDDWKNRVTSVQPWAGCWLWLYPEPNLGGERDGPFKENTSQVGDLMNDRTQSVGLS